MWTVVTVSNDSAAGLIPPCHFMALALKHTSRIRSVN
jgi:hypothetical protein